MLKNENPAAGGTARGAKRHGAAGQQHEGKGSLGGRPSQASQWSFGRVCLDVGRLISGTPVFIVHVECKDGSLSRLFDGITSTSHAKASRLGHKLAESLKVKFEDLTDGPVLAPSVFPVRGQRVYIESCRTARLSRRVFVCQSVSPAGELRPNPLTSINYIGVQRHSWAIAAILGTQVFENRVGARHGR
jgi:hypothetical protein